jgi:hypothetical protein
MTPTTRVAIASLASSVAWAAIAWAISARWVGDGSRFGAAAAPLIGLGVGLASRRAGEWNALGRWLTALAALYGSAAAFGLAVGLGNWWTRRSYGVNAGVVWEGVAATLWGLTLAGWFLLLWPLAYLNLCWTWRLARD